MFDNDVCVNGLQAREYIVCKPDCFLLSIHTVRTDAKTSVNKYFELKTRGAAAPTQTTCSSSQLLVRVVVHQDHVVSVY